MTMWPLLTLLPGTNMSACLTPAPASVARAGQCSDTLDTAADNIFTSTAVICTTAAIMIGSDDLQLHAEDERPRQRCEDCEH